MKKNEAESLVNLTFTQSFEEGRFKRFIDNLFNKYEQLPDKTIAGQYIPESYREGVLSYKRLAKFTDPEGLEVDVLAVKLRNRHTLENARTMQRNFVARYLNGNGGDTFRDAALVAFYSDDMTDWRFSLVRMDYVLDEEQNKLRKELTPARRYSFLVGQDEKTHTVRTQLLPVLQSETEITLSQLEQAFNIELVTKEFFEKYKELYLRLKEALEEHLKKDLVTQKEFEVKDVKTADFAKRLLGQIVFLYFLQKKGWLGVARGAAWGSGPKDFLKRLFEKEFINYHNFFNDILEPLFYEALATERDENYYKQFSCRIPFLNGGLFEAIHGYDWVNTDILLDNSIFSRIFEVFDLYNFTVREDEPLDKEVAVDPEMLGKVFENLIPENERKGSGTFYTRREIVHYMCQESLINYLDCKLNNKQQVIQDQPQPTLFPEFAKIDLFTTYEDVYLETVPRQDLVEFIYHGDGAQENDTLTEVKNQANNYTGKYQYQLPESVRKAAKTIDEALSEVKVCDPAIGSGAFPVGIMNELVRSRLSLNPFLGSEGRSAYEFKRHAIQESIYGVDIEPSAVDIAKLRLWLSLVVDEDDFGNIQPLPNLDYKIVVGNSLIGFPFDTNSRVNKLREISPLKSQYFESYSQSQKLKLRNKINQIINSEYDNPQIEKTLGYKVNFDFRWSFFEIFDKKGGFDIVIANPPYVSIEKFSGTKEQKVWKDNFQVFAARGDIYCLFYEKGYKLLNKFGTLCYITSNKFFKAGYGKKLREFMVQQVTPLKIIDFGELPVFEAGTDPCILLIQNSKPNPSIFAQVATIKDKKEILNVSESFANRSQNLKLDQLSSEGWSFTNDKARNLLDKVKKQGIPLKSYVKNSIHYGIKTGFNEAFVINAEQRAGLIKADPRSEELIKPWLRGQDIQRWYYKYNNLFVIVIKNGFNEQLKKYPAILERLTSFEEELRARGQCEGKKDKPGTKQHHWLELDNNPTQEYFSIFEKPKIVYNETSKKLHAFIDYNNFYINKTGFIIISNNTEYILGLLNSQLFDFYYRNEFPAWGDPWAGGRIQFRGDRMAKIPIVDADPENKKAIADLVNQIQQRMKIDPSSNVGALEKKIDQLVYKLYGLNAQEITLVENSVIADDED